MEEVLAGLFTIVNKSFGITMKQVFDVPVYHEEVTTWEARQKMAAISCFILIFSPEIPSAAEHGRLAEGARNVSQGHEETAGVDS